MSTEINQADAAQADATPPTKPLITQTKPMIVNLPKVSWDALILFEDLQDKIAAGGKPRIRELRALVVGFFEGWTEEDAGKITQEETKLVFEQLVAGLGDTPPKETGDS